MRHLKKYEKHLLVGTFLTFLGILGLYKFGVLEIMCWVVIIFGKLLVILSILEYRDYKRAFRGEDLSKDHKIKKFIRRVRRKYYR